MAITFPADRAVFAFFQSTFAGSSPLFRLFLDLWCVWMDGWIYLSSTVTKQRRNSYGLCLNSAKLCSAAVSWLCLLSGVNKCSDSFLMSEISYRIYPTRSFWMPTVSGILVQPAVCQYEIADHVIPSVIAVFCARGRGSSKTDVKTR